MPDAKELLQRLLKAYQQKEKTLSEEETKQLANDSNEKLCDIISLCSLILSNRAIDDNAEALKKVHEATTAATAYLGYIRIADKENSERTVMDLSSWPVNISARAWVNRPIKSRNTALYDYLGLAQIPNELGVNLPLTEIKPHSQSSNWQSIVFQMGYNAVYTMRFPDGLDKQPEEILEFIQFPVSKSMDQADINLLSVFSEGLSIRIIELPRPNYDAVSQWAEAILDYLGLMGGWGQESFLTNFLSEKEQDEFKSNLREAREHIKKNFCKRIRRINAFQK